MEKQYHDMYALFRSERGAEEYFDALPSYVQDRIRPRWGMIDSFGRLESMAERCRKF